MKTNIRIEFILFLFFFISQISLAQLKLLQDQKNFHPFEGYLKFENEVNTHLKSVLNDLEEFEIDIYYDGEIFKYAQIIIKKSSFDYSIIKRATNDYGIVDLKAFNIISAFVEAIEIYNYLCPQIMYDTKKLYTKITYINRLKDFKNVWHQLKINVDYSTGVTPNITSVMYDDYTVKSGPIKIDYIFNQPCAFATYDKMFIDFLLDNQY